MEKLLSNDFLVEGRLSSTFSVENCRSPLYAVFYLFSLQMILFLDAPVFYFHTSFTHRSMLLGVVKVPNCLVCLWVCVGIE